MGIHHTPDDYSQDVQSCAGETASVSEDSGVVSASSNNSRPLAPLMAAVLSTTDNDMTSTTASTSQENAPSTVSESSSSSPGPMAVPLAPPCNYDDEEDETDEDETDADNTTPNNDNDTPLPYSRIRFPSNESQLTTHHPGADVSELAAYRPHIWYQYEELKSMKRTALALAKEAQRLSQGSLLTHTYGRATSQDSQHALVAWACLGQTRRGLERWINEEYAAKRSDIRQRTIQSVIRAQAKLKENTTKHDNNSSSSSPPVDTTDVEYSIKVLARLSEAFSIDSRQFARSMGLADEKAAQEALQQTDTTISEEPLTHRQSIRNASSSSTTTTASYAPSSPAKKRLSLTGGSHHSTKSSHPSSRVVPKPPRRPGQRTTATSTTSTNRRRGGLTAPSVSADFRHYY